MHTSPDCTRPGQGLAAVVITALLQWVSGHGELRRVKTSPTRAKDENEQVLRDLKVAMLTEAAVPPVQGGMDKLSDDKLPDRVQPACDAAPGSCGDVHGAERDVCAAAGDRLARGGAATAGGRPPDCIACHTR